MTRALFFALLALLPGVDAMAADAPFGDVARRLAPNASSITSCSTSSGSGQYRTVVFHRGFEHVSSEVYIQWLAWDQDGAHVLRSVLVAELSTGSWWVGDPVVLSREKCSMLLPATHTYSSETARFVLQPKGRGKYALRQVVKK